MTQMMKFLLINFNLSNIKIETGTTKTIFSSNMMNLLISSMNLSTITLKTKTTTLNN